MPKKFYSSPDTVLINHIKNVLASYGIKSFLKNEFLGGGVGEIPYNECWVELWLSSEKDEAKAHPILADIITEPAKTETWHCTRCGEKLEGQFTHCWQCGESRYRE